MRLLLLVACAASAAVAQGTKAPAKVPAKPAGPIVVGGSSTARPAAVATAPAATAPVAKPGVATAASPAGKPTVAANTPAPVSGAAAPSAKTPSPVAAPATKAPPPVTAPAGKATVVAAVPSGKPSPAATTPAGKGAAPATPAGAAAPAATPASTPVSTPASTATPASGPQGGGASITIERESFGYERGSRRDPFTSLLQADELRPTMADLRLVGVIVDPRGRNSIAVLRDLSTKEMYRLRSGATIGRLRVTQISQRSVTFVIEEFGVSRQEVLSLRDSTSVRNP